MGFLVGSAFETFLCCFGAAFLNYILEPTIDFPELVFDLQRLALDLLGSAFDFWQEGQALQVNLAPEADLAEDIAATRQRQGRTDILTLMSRHLPRRLAASILEREAIAGRIADLSSADVARLHDAVHNWQVVPAGTEGYRTAEVTLGGVDTAALSSKTMEAKSCPGLYFIGEVIDVTGHLGGYNFQWAWSSGWVAGQYA